MREALAGGEVVDEAPSPREIGEDDTGLGRHERGTEGDRPVRQAVERGVVEGERVGAGDEKIEGLLQGVER
jgi:hypothetical protein